MQKKLRRPLMIASLPVLFVSILGSCINGSFRFHPDIDSEIIRLASLSESEIPDFMQTMDRTDIIAEYYQDPDTRKSVVDFFVELTHSEKIATAILENSERFKVPPSLAFALAYEESKFQTGAVNNNGDSVDRGLFQLNSKSFPKLGSAEVFDPMTNARYGISHLDFCLKTGENVVAALAMYNAGSRRVSKDGTPRKTLNYIFRITKYQENITSLFAAKVVAGERLRVASGFKIKSPE